LKVRLFIELIEVPCIAVQIQAQPNAPMMASIQVPPMHEGTKLHPRSVVHVFFHDFDEQGASMGVARDVTTTGKSEKTQAGQTINEQRAGNKQLIADFDNQHYKLVFCGELFGFTWTKSPSNRSLVLQCADLSNYWDYAYQFNNTSLFGPGYKAMFSGGSTNLFTDILSTPGNIAVQIIKTPCTRYPQLKGLLGGLIHLLEAMGGSYYYGHKYAGMNIFFSIAELRLRLTQMITAYEKDPTSHKLLAGSYDGLFGRGIGNLGEQASYRKIISMLAGVIFHEVFPQPCPFYRPGTQGTPSGSMRKSIQEMEVFGPIANRANGLRSMMEAISDGTKRLLRDDEVWARGGWASEIKQRAKYGDNTYRECLSLALRSDQEVPRARSMKCENVATMGQKLSALLRQAAQCINRCNNHMKNATTKGKMNAVVTEAEKAIAIFEKIQDLEAEVTRQDKVRPPILSQQIIKPDVWFSAPPRCNVLFPEHYTQFDYSRQFMQEPTRLLLKTNDEFFGEDILFDNFYFAPKAITLKGQANTLRGILRNDILDHELFTGILPIFEKMGEFNIFAARSGRVDGQTPKLGLAQRSCNFLYFKHRFAARQLTVTCRFHPYLAVGFPGLVLDQYVDLATVRRYNELIASLPEAYSGARREVDQMLGTHFLANFTQVSHNLDARGNGVTTVNAGYARQVDESVRFLGAEQGEVDYSKPQAKTGIRHTDVAIILSPRLHAVGPAGGKIVDVEDVTSVYATPSADGKQLPLFATMKNGKKAKSSVVVGAAKQADAFGPEVVELMGDPQIMVRFHAFRITEEVQDKKDTRVELAPEEYIRPGWYGDCWASSNISEVYYDFFNIGAITEAMQVQNAASATKPGMETSDAATTVADAINGNSGQLAVDQLIRISQANGSTIEDAVNFLALTYSVVKQAGFDADAFVQSYCWRPIASMLDMFGTYDLKLSADGERVVEGIEGFHSRCAGPYENLFGIIIPNIEEIVGIKRGTVQASKADKRLEKMQKVLTYTARLRVSRALLG